MTVFLFNYDIKSEVNGSIRLCPGKSIAPLQLIEMSESEWEQSGIDESKLPEGIRIERVSHDHPALNEGTTNLKLLTLVVRHRFEALQRECRALKRDVQLASATTARLDRLEAEWNEAGEEDDGIDLIRKSAWEASQKVLLDLYEELEFHMVRIPDDNVRKAIEVSHRIFHASIQSCLTSD